MQKNNLRWPSNDHLACSQNFKNFWSQTIPTNRPIKTEHNWAKSGKFCRNFWAETLAEVHTRKTNLIEYHFSNANISPEKFCNQTKVVESKCHMCWMWVWSAVGAKPSNEEVNMLIVERYNWKFVAGFRKYFEILALIHYYTNIIWIEVTRKTFCCRHAGKLTSYYWIMNLCENIENYMYDFFLNGFVCFEVYLNTVEWLLFFCMMKPE